MTMPVLVTGGTGTLGRRLVPRLTEAGCAVRVLTRRARPDEDGVRYLTGDLATGEGVGPAVDGVATIVHCAGGAKGDDALTRNLVEAVSQLRSLTGTMNLAAQQFVDQAKPLDIQLSPQDSAALRQPLQCPQP